MRTLTQIIATVTLLAFACVIAQADCNCSNSGTMAVTGVEVPVVPFGSNVPLVGYNYLMASQFANISRSNSAVHEPHPMPADGRRYPVFPAGTGVYNEVGLVPQVPGTIGQTYQRRTHAIPEDKHPRLGMLAVRDQGTVKHLSVQRMSGFRMKEDVWLYETDKPLTSWTENIVRIEARQEAEDVEPYKTMFVRLITGRLVYLDFH